jgi:hypothetical protein
VRTNLVENLGLSIFQNAPEPGGKIALFGPKSNTQNSTSDLHLSNIIPSKPEVTIDKRLSSHFSPSTQFSYLTMNQPKQLSKSTQKQQPPENMNSTTTITPFNIDEKKVQI